MAELEEFEEEEGMRVWGDELDDDEDFWGVDSMLDLKRDEG